MSTGGLYFMIVLGVGVRTYFVYLIYSFCKRLERGETLLIDYGGRRLNKMIEELKDD